MSKKIVIILSIILIVVVVGLGLWWYFSSIGKLPSPAELLNKPAQPAGGIINPEATTTATAPEFPGLPADQRTSSEVILDNLVRNFVERAGSFSTDNLAAAKQSLISLGINPTLVNRLIVPLPPIWQSVASRALKLELLQAETDLKNYEVTVQRDWQAVGSEAVSYQKMRVSITNQGGDWKITQAEWQ